MKDNFPYCPTNELDCPYYSIKSGRCMMYKQEGVPPYNECDAWYGLDEEEEEDE